MHRSNFIFLKEALEEEIPQEVSSLDKFIAPLKQYKDEILKKYEELKVSPEAQELAIQKVKRKFGLSESCLVFPQLVEGNHGIQDRWKEILYDVFGIGIVISLMTLAILLTAAEMWAFMWLFSSFWKGIVAYLLVHVVSKGLNGDSLLHYALKRSFNKRETYD